MEILDWMYTKVPVLCLDVLGILHEKLYQIYVLTIFWLMVFEA